MSAKEYSLRIELLLREINSNCCEKSDEILLNPYNEIVSALQYYVSQEKLDKFKLYYQAIIGQTLQEIIDNNYDVEQLVTDLKRTIEDN